MFIRIVGTHNTENEVFHCVHFEAPAQAEIAANQNNSPEPSSGSHNTETTGLIFVEFSKTFLLFDYLCIGLSIY